MLAHKAKIFSQLQQEILRTQGYRRLPPTNSTIPRLGPIDSSFPNQTFPIAAIHEFLTAEKEDIAATYGFIAMLLSSLMKNGGATVWLNAEKTVFAPGLTYFGINPDKIIFISAAKEKEKLWLLEEALKCEGLAAVVGEINQLTFTISRRLQLAIETGRTTGLIVNLKSKIVNQNSVTARWRITSLPSITNELPGIGFPSWKIELLKMRNGRTGVWEMQWLNNRLQVVNRQPATSSEQPSTSILKAG